MSDLPEILERFRRGPEFVAVVMTGAAGEEVDFSPAPGQWTIRQIARHLADSELVGAQRFRMVLAEDNPTLMGHDEKAWAEKLDYAQRKPSESLEMFRRVRADNFELLKNLPESAYGRTGTHSERGRVTLRDLLETYAEHAENHARQMQRVRDVWKKNKVKK